MSRFFIILFGLITVCPAAPVDLWFEQANRFYEQSAFDSAAVYYEKVVESGMNSAELFYNLGNAEYRLNHLGPAVLYYEKAFKLAPDDPDIQNNLKFANLNIVDRLPAVEKGFIEATLRRLHTMMPLGAQLWLLAGLLFVLAALFSAGLFASRNIRLWFTYLGGCILLLTLGLGISAGIKVYQEENVSYAVVLTASIDAKNQPEGTKILFTAHEGTKFLVRKRLDNWSLVSLPNGVSGWIENSTIGAL
jgi:tetratricopeptide (TPR) repeat protein